MKRLGSPWTCAGCGLVLWNVLLFAATAAGQLAVSPSIVSFSSVQMGSSVSQSMVLSNTANSNLTISQATVSGNGFSISGLGMPLTLAAGQNASFTAIFAPQSSGSTSGSLSLSYSFLKIKTHGKGSPSSTGTATVSLTGTGITPGQLTSNPSGLNFANVPVGSSQTQSATLTNSGASSLTVSQATLTGTGFTVSSLALPLTLGAGQSASFSLVFAPQSAGSVSGNVAFTSDASNPTMNLPLSGNAIMPGQLTANPASLAFGSVQVGSSLTLMDSLTNTGGASVTISQATVTGAGFSISGLNLPLVLNPGASVTFSAVFAPPSAANISGGITVSSDVSNPTLAVPFSGTGTAQGQLTLTPTALDFGSVTVGTNISQASSLSASGASVTVSSASLSSVEFSLTGVSFPLTIAAGQSLPLTLTFAPQASGTASTMLSFTSNASNAPTEILSGDGIAPPQHSVSLSWTDAGPGIVGYNVYRGNVSGGPYTRINSALNATAAYGDDSVLAGQTYYYVTTAVDGSGVESAYSNEAQAVIPSP
ncbi:MAG: choice-of-anchor D domain-containing protein [Acidobacteriia bacterium]|nr:choice-of-anchor D domain-containing protein [Terriglobia bacterium]